MGGGRWVVVGGGGWVVGGPVVDSGRSGGEWLACGW